MAKLCPCPQFPDCECGDHDDASRGHYCGISDCDGDPATCVACRPEPRLGALYNMRMEPGAVAHGSLAGYRAPGLTVDGAVVTFGGRLTFPEPFGDPPDDAGVYTVTKVGSAAEPFVLTRGAALDVPCGLCGGDCTKLGPRNPACPLWKVS